MTQPRSYAAVVRPRIRVGKPAIELSAKVEGKLRRVLVDIDLHRPDMFELVFWDDEGDVTDLARLTIGATVEVYGGDTAGGSQAQRLIVGEVTAIEAICDEGVYTVVRGYDSAHRLQSVRRTRTFVQMTDGAIARRIASEAGLTIGEIAPGGPVHGHVSQVAQTDWDFLQQRAREAGYETGVEDGRFYFRARPAAGPGGAPGRGGPTIGLRGLSAGASGLQLRFKDNLLTFRPRVTGANITSEVEVRVWDPDKAAVVVGSAPTRTAAAALDDKPDKLAGAFGGPALGRHRLPAPSSLGGRGQEPSAKAYVVVDRPVANGTQISRTANQVARSVADHVGSAFAEAEGYGYGNPDIRAGAVVTVSGVPAAFCGKWTVTSARHTFDASQGGYRTWFYASGSQDRSLLGLASLGGTHDAPDPINGVVCGVVTNVNDPWRKGRVKVALPWLAPSYESEWARVAQIIAGQRSGAAFIPEVGDEVLVGFEFGDPRRPYVIGGLINAKSKFNLGGPMVKPMGRAGEVVRRGIVSSAGNKLVFSDEVPAGPSPTVSEVVLGTGDGKLALTIDQVAGTVSLRCDPQPPKSKKPTGTLVIECGKAGVVEIKTGPGGNIKIDSGGTLDLRAKAAVQIESSGPVSIKGNPIKLN